MYKKFAQKIINYLGYAVIKKKNFKKLYRSLDDALIPILKKKNPVIFDIGAHEGETIKRCKKIFNNPILHCFEPQKKCFDKIKKFASKSIKVNNYALGSKISKKKFFIYNKSASSSFNTPNKKSIFSKNLKIISTYDIKINSLDNYVHKNKINQIDLLKIDVQGYEDLVLKGSTKSLKKILLIELELIFVDYYKKKQTFLDIEKIISPYSFEIFSLSSPRYSNENQIMWVDALYINKNLFKKNNGGK